ncbi:MAG: CBS domain-containing protein [Pseudomonadota bacterium]
METCEPRSIEGILVRDLMSTEVIKVRPGDTVVAVGNILSERRISGAVVVENEKVVGVISKESFVTGVKYMGINSIDSFKVKDFMVRTYDSAKADESLNDVIERINISPKRVDRVLVFDGGSLVGILTRSDIAKVFSEHAKGCYRVRDLMQVNPVVVNDYTSIKEIIEEITIARDKRVIVMAGEKVLGVITVLDLSLALFEKLKENKDKNAIDLIQLDDIITLEPIIISEKADAAEAAGIMVENRIGGLPVYDQKLEGVITKTDIVKGYKIFKDAKKRKK